MAVLHGGLDEPGSYLVLMKWYPGYMSAPHYVTGRLSLVLSGTWRVNSGADFEPENTVPVPAGGFVRRVMHTPHYGGVKADGKEPAVIALFGIAPVHFALVGGNALSDEDAAGGGQRDGAACPRLQFHQGDEYHWRQAPDGRHRGVKDAEAPFGRGYNAQIRPRSASWVPQKPGKRIS
jgi:hypothetical protein